MYVIFIHGPPAVGKYTIGKLVSDHLHMPLYHNHLAVDLATCLFDFGSEAFKLLRESIWLKSFELAAAHGQSFIFTFNPEATVAEDLIPRLMNLLRSNGGDDWGFLRKRRPASCSRCRCPARAAAAEPQDASFVPRRSGK